MIDRPSVLCPVDFSDASRGALRLAVTVAEHFFATLTVAAVNDPLLASGAAAAYHDDRWLERETHQLLDAFIDETLGARPAAVAECHRDVATGKPAVEILTIAQSRRADLIVMSSHGLTGPRKWLLGSTTERVLRDTTTAVLVTPARAQVPIDLEAMRLRSVLAPIDLSAATAHQVRVASGLAKALDTALILAHVVEPIRGRPGHELILSRLRAERRRVGQHTLSDLVGQLPANVRASVVMASGQPAAEIVRLARLTDAGVVVMGLHASAGLGPRMGAVTYRVLCRTNALVLALPPRLEAGVARPLRGAGALSIVAG